MKKMFSRLKHEIVEAIPPAIFFFIVFQLIAFSNALMLEDLLDEVVWSRFCAVQIWLLVLFFVYCSLRELVRVLGRERVPHMFLGAPKSRKAQM